MKKKIVLTAVSVIIAIALIVGLSALYLTYRPKGNTDSKKITVEIISVESKKTTVEIKTSQEFLRGALEEKNLIKGDESEYGIFVKEVNGYTANESKQEWWCFTKGGESVVTGVDSTPILDGDKFEITLKTGYDN